MAISIIAVGTRGDVQPLIALGVGLSRSGFDVQIATHPNFRHIVESFHLDNSAVFLKLLKDHNNPDLGNLHIKLDPQTLLVKPRFV